MRVMGEAMQHERKRLESLGGRMMMGVVHWDESHVHVHLYGLDLSRGRVDHLHPGRAAKTAFHAAHKGEPAKDVKKAANTAYCDAMRCGIANNLAHSGISQSHHFVQKRPKHLCAWPAFLIVRRSNNLE